MCQLMGHLPARAEGSSWHLYYSSSVHGYSLRTLFRLMTGVDSPVLLVVMDTQHHVSPSVSLSVCLFLSLSVSVCTLPYSQQHLSYDDCLEDKREDCVVYDSCAQ